MGLYVQARIVPVVHLQVRLPGKSNYVPIEGIVSKEVLSDIYEQISQGIDCNNSLAGSDTQYAVLKVVNGMVRTKNGNQVVSIDSLEADIANKG